MLRKFSVTGYRCFRDKLTFDLTKAHDYEFNKHLVRNGLIASGIIYGVNGSGKSSLGFALFDIVGVLTDYELAATMKDKTSYINADTEQKVASFEYEFCFGTQIVNYRYIKRGPAEIQEERLEVDGKVVLTRLETEMTYTNEKLKVPELPPHISALRYVYRNTPLKETDVVAEVIKFVEKMLWFRSLSSRGYCGYTSRQGTLTGELDTPEKVKGFEAYLDEMAGIKLKLESAVSASSGERELYVVYPNKKIDFFNASSTGTQELLLLYYWQTVALKEVKFLFIDEFDAFYHYELAAKIVQDISSRVGMQSYFTSHNTYLANNRIMRPDCFFILSKGKIISFADATERELREGHNLEKLLRSGEFGE